MLTVVLALACPSVAMSQQGETMQTMNVVVLGDSNSWLGGDDCDKPEGWTRWFKEAFKPTSCRSYARSGATWTCTEKTQRNVTENIGTLGDDNVIYNQICRLQEAVSEGQQQVSDLVFISAGTNDVWFKSHRPCALSEDSVSDRLLESIKNAPANRLLTLVRSVANGCATLKSLYPNVKIILLTPMQTTKASLADVERAGDIMECCARTMGIGCIRLDKQSCVERKIEQQRFTYTKDGTHTNVDGARRNGELVANETIAILRKASSND